MKTLSGDRFNNGKPEISLVPYAGVEGIARASMYGKKKYSRDNWRGGMSQSGLLDCLLRHAIKLADPDEGDFDEESGLHHADHIAWNAAVICHAVKHDWPMLDDADNSALKESKK